MKVKKAFVALAVFLVGGLIVGDHPGKSPGEVIGMLAMAAIALLILMAVVSCWGWLKRRLFKNDDKVVLTDSGAARPPVDAPRMRDN